MEFLVSASNELKASSKIIMLEFLYKALAMLILCLSPPEIFDPISPNSYNNYC